MADSLADALNQLPPEDLPDYTVDTLAAMNDGDFAQFVADHLGSDEPRRLWDDLLGPTLLERTSTTLVSIVTDLGAQATARRADFDQYRLDSLLGGLDLGREEFLAAKVEYEDWRKRSGRFRRLVEVRLRQARQAERVARRLAHQEHQERNRDQHRRIAARLAAAIHAHRRSLLGAETAPETHDLELWRLLDELTIEVGDAEVTLTQALDYGFWTLPARD